MDWIEKAEGFTRIVEGAVRGQFPDVIITEPHPGLFGWRRGTNSVQMQVNDPGGTVRVAFIPEAPDAPPQTFPYADVSVPAIAARSWSGSAFRRRRQRGL